MSSDVRIDRIHHTLHSPHPLDADALRRWHALMADLDLESLGHGVGDDEWVMIRRLKVNAQWHTDRAGLDTALAWSQAVQQATAALLADPHHPDVVRYRDRRHALADLIYRCAQGDARRQWAWQRMGWWSGPQRANEGLQHGVQAAAARPEWIWPMVTQWLVADAETGAWGAVLRALTPAQWWTWLSRVPAARPYVDALSRPVALRAADDRGMAPGGGPDALALPGLDEAGHRPVLADRLVDWMRRRPGQVMMRADVLTVMLAALCWPDRTSGERVRALRLGRARAEVMAACGLLPPAPGQPAARAADATDLNPLQRLAQAGHGPHAGDPEDDGDGAPPAATEVDDDAPVGPELPDATDSVRTDWAGALFWLRALQAPGVLDELLGPTTGEHQPDSRDPLAHALRAVVRALGVPDDDPAQRAFTGGQLPEGEPQPGVVDAARALVARWQDGLDAAAPELEVPRLRTVCKRPGMLRFEPGWIELHLPLDQVDTRLRRLGLDLDPGHLPWLGCVVRIRYV